MIFDFAMAAWDKEMVDALAEDWSGMFCDYMQHILVELMSGTRGALSEFMRLETERVLAYIEVLGIPGNKEDLGGGIGYTQVPMLARNHGDGSAFHDCTAPLDRGFWRESQQSAGNRTDLSTSIFCPDSQRDDGGL